MEAESTGWKDFFIDLASGAVAGVTMILASQPFEYWSILLLALSKLECRWTPAALELLERYETFLFAKE
jgi:hypothetical protein